MTDAPFDRTEIPGAGRLSWSLASAGGVAVAATGFVVLIGWAVGAEPLKSFGGVAVMKANAAFCFVLLGISVWAARRSGQLRGTFQRVSGLAVIIIGGLTLAEYVFGTDLGLDQVLFTEPAGVADISNQGRMAPTTALGFVLLGSSFLSRGALRPKRFRRTNALVVIAAAIAFLAFLGHLYGASALYGIGSFTPMAMHTSLAFLVLCVAVIAIAPQGSIGAVLLRTSAGGVVARRLVPVALVVPPFVGWVRLLGERAGLYDTAFGVSIVVVAHVVIFTGLAGWVAWTLDHDHARLVTAERTAATDALTGVTSRRAILDKLERLVASGDGGSTSFSVLAIDADRLKQLNDRDGHAAGDAALVRMAKVIVHTLRDSDIAGRVGGDEFIALLPATSGPAAQVIAQRLRDAFGEGARAEGALTASIGVFTWSTGVTALQVIEAADRALYAEKRARVLVA